MHWSTSRRYFPLCSPLAPVPTPPLLRRELRLQSPAAPRVCRTMAASAAPSSCEHVVVDPNSFPWRGGLRPQPPAGPQRQTEGQGSYNSAEASAQPHGLSLTHIQHDEPLLDAHADPPTASYTADISTLQHAAELLKEGQAVAIPTETVYGLAANAMSEEAVAKIYSIKQRPADNPLIVHVSSLDMLRSLYPKGWQLPEVYLPVLAAAWPGPLTILLPRSPRIPESVTCGQPTMAVRMPAHPVARALIALSGLPLAAPSANSSGRPSPTLASHVLQDLEGRGLPMIIDGGPCSSGVESTVLDALRVPPVVLRPGGVTYEWLKEMPGLEKLQVYSKHFVDMDLEQAPTTPGMKYRHYSPHALVILIELPTEAHDSGTAGLATTTVDSQNRSSLDELRMRMQQEVEVQLRSLLDSGHYQRLAVLRTSRTASGTTGPCNPEAWRTACDSHVLLPAISVMDVAERDRSVSIAAAAAAENRLGSFAAASEDLVAHASGADGKEPQQGQDAADSKQPSSPPLLLEYELGSLEQPASVARELFRALRMVDEAGVGAVLVEGVFEVNEGMAIMNRLRKAATHTIRLGQVAAQK